jgi:hypothetical protein
LVSFQTGWLGGDATLLGYRMKAQTFNEHH